MSLPLALCLVALGSGDGIINRYEHVIPGSYLIRVNDSVTDLEQLADEFERTYGGCVTGIIHAPIPVVFVDGWSRDSARAASRDPRVDFIEENTLMSLAGPQRFHANTRKPGFGRPTEMAGALSCTPRTRQRRAP